jgi:DNA modification methylase
MITDPTSGRVLSADYAALLADLPDESVDLILTDPPYGIGYQNPYTHDAHDMLDGDAAPFSYALLAREAYRVLRPGSAVLMFTGWSVYPDHYRDVEAAGFTMREPVIGQKRPAGATNLDCTFQPNSDWLIFATKGRFRFQPVTLLRNKRAGTIPNKGRQPVPEWKQRFPSCWFGTDFPYSSENSAFQKANDLRHPTIKGQEFCRWLIELTCPPGGLVVDPFVGSGTVAAAAAECGRQYVVGDVNPTYADMAARRLGSLA